VEKYKPKSTKEVIANPAAVKKLQDWLQGWQRSEVQRAKRGEAPARGATQKNAALLSGPPGIGKTTTAHLVAAECGYYALEFNASDTRSKKMIKVSTLHLASNVSLFVLYTMTHRWCSPLSCTGAPGPVDRKQRPGRILHRTRSHTTHTHTTNMGD
jgi:replication factor C subunit 1